MLNILHLKYAVEIAETRSISKAAENLYMGQPNLSRAIKELEAHLGITIFKRTSRGITVTPEGEEFLQYAKKIVSEVNEIEAMYREGKKPKQSFSVCVPRASYISAAFAAFSRHISTAEPAEIFYKETNSMRTIKNVAGGEYNLGILRYQLTFEKYFRSLFSEKNLVAETVTDFSYLLLLSENHPLAKKETILSEDLGEYIEISHGDPYVPSLPMVDVKKQELSRHVDKRIFVFERGSQFELLEKVPSTFMWASPVPKALCEKYHLIQRECQDNDKVYRDVLVYRKGYRLTSLDQQFITDVCEAKRKYIEKSQPEENQ